MKPNEEPFPASLLLGAALVVGVLIFAYQTFREINPEPVSAIEASREERLEFETPQNLQKIYDQVAFDAEERYRIALRQGYSPDICAASMMVSAAHLQAKNEPKYREWKNVEAAACR